MAYISSTPKNHTYTLAPLGIPIDSIATHFEVGRYVKPVNRHMLNMQVEDGPSISISLQPNQHWKVTEYNAARNMVTLSFKRMTITLPMKHANEMFKDYDQTADGDVLYTPMCNRK